MTTLSSEAHNGHIHQQEAYSNGYGNAAGIRHGHGSASTDGLAFAHHKFSHLTLYTGNTMRTGTTGQLNTNLKKSNQELVSAVQDTLLYSLGSARIKGDSITITDETSTEPLEVKMFYLPSSSTSSGSPLPVEYLNVAITDLEALLGIPEIKLDHFILALPNQSFDENGLDESEVQSFTNEIETVVMPVWKQLSLLYKAGRIGRLGVAEFSRQQLEVLKQVAAQDPDGIAIAPEVNQVNLQDCCVLPKDLIQYSKDQGVELLTHGDLTHILPKETFSALLKPHLPVAAESLVPNFVLKYSAFITCRGLVTKKGYIVDASSSV
ncbi:hypothetical protein EDD11_007337 [Mortierella claussenii]|nr:hypothetical protein EDD11_007337 [Mortierella claussenii]